MVSQPVACFTVLVAVRPLAVAAEPVCPVKAHCDGGLRNTMTDIELCPYTRFRLSDILALAGGVIPPAPAVPASQY